MPPVQIEMKKNVMLMYQKETKGLKEASKVVGAAVHLEVKAGIEE